MKDIKKWLALFFKYDPRYRICSHVLQFNATLIMFYINVIDALLIRLYKKSRPKNALKTGIREITTISPKCSPTSTKNPLIQQKINIYTHLSTPPFIQVIQVVRYLVSCKMCTL